MRSIGIVYVFLISFFVSLVLFVVASFTSASLRLCVRLVFSLVYT